MSKEPLELELYWKSETDKAYLVCDGDIDAWLPKSQVDVEASAKLGEDCTFLVPEWLALDKGLL